MTVQLRRDTSVNWATNNPVLAEGEIGVDLTAKRLKIGDGTSAWNVLQFTDTVYDSTAVDGHIADSDIHFTQGQITITKSQISDFGNYEPADSTILKEADVGVSVQAFNVDTVIDSGYVHTDNNYTNDDKNKLSGIAAGAEVNVNADWNATSGDAQIMNKPTTIGGYGITDAYTKTEVQTALPVVGFDTANVVPPNAGQLAWNQDEKTLDLGINGVTLQLGQEELTMVRNTTGATIPNKTLVIATGSIGNSGRITVAPYNLGDPKYIIGIATEDIAAGVDGFVTREGKVRGVDTSMWADGQLLFAAADGGLTNVEPAGVKVPVAFVVHAHTSGTLYVRRSNFDENAYQTKLVSGSSIKTVNGTSLLGSGDIVTSTTVVNNTLTSTSTTEALSAAQGKVLNASKLGLTGGTMTGAITGLKETKVAMAANNIDLRLGNLFTKTISGATTLTVSNVPTSGTVGYVILELTNAGSAVVTWFSGVKWAGGKAPTLTSAGKDIISFYTHDGGTTWNVIGISKDVK